jgi:tetratricopeptide (TPR) repeat protein
MTSLRRELDARYHFTNAVKHAASVLVGDKLHIISAGKVMSKTYAGKCRAAILEDLSSGWLKEGPAVCILQGFSGVGKSALARELCKKLQEHNAIEEYIIHDVIDSANTSALEILMELAIKLSQLGQPQMERVLFGQSNPNLAYAVELALRRPVLIVLDEAQRLLRASDGAALAEINGVFALLRDRPTLPGRLLLLSNQLVQEERWSEWILKKTLNRLEPNEAIFALDKKLEEAGLTPEISEERKLRVACDLDCNPRAIEALVSALRYDTLDDIIESNPRLWEARDRQLSLEFSAKLERELLQRTMDRLGEDRVHLLRLVAVHRRAFKADAIDKIGREKKYAREARRIWISHFLASHYDGHLTLNPIVREICLSHLREKPKEFRAAHGLAADYHARRFDSKRIVGSYSTLGGSFLELRYHLVQAARQSRLSVFSRRLTDYLRDEFKSNSSVPREPEELNERIAVLRMLLETGGDASELEMYLARCLLARNDQSDIAEAIGYAEQGAEQKRSEELWLFLAKLKFEHQGSDAALDFIHKALPTLVLEPGTTLYGFGAELLVQCSKTDQAIALLRQGIEKAPVNQGVSLYDACGRLLANAGRTGEAIDLLRQGIEKVPPGQGASLYDACGRLLANAGKPGEAIDLLRQGIEMVPPGQGASFLYDSCGRLLANAGRTGEAIDLLRQGIEKVPPGQGASLYDACGRLLANAGKTGEAIDLLRQGIEKVPSGQGGVSLYDACGKLLANAGKTGEAIDLLRKGIEKVPPGQGGVSLYDACGRLLASAGKTGEAIDLLRQGIEKVPPGQVLALATNSK